MNEVAAQTLALELTAVGKSVTGSIPGQMVLTDCLSKPNRPSVQRKGWKMFNLFSADGLVGMTKDEAVEKIKSSGFKVRIQPTMGTCEVNMTRVNIEVKDDKVVKAWLG